MPVNLTTAALGDRFVARDGEVWSYDGVTTKWWNREILYRFHQYAAITAFFTEAGLHIGGDGNDLIRAIDSPALAPAEPMGYAGLVERLREWASSAGHSQITSLKRDLMLAAGGIDALLLRATKAEAALDEARKVIASLGNARIRDGE